MYQKMKNSALPPPLYKCIVVLVAAAALMLTACGGLNGDDGIGNVTITLPNVSAAPSANAKAVGRSISPDAIAGLRRDTVRYRVHMNNRVLEGTGGNFSANFPVGLKVDVYVECIGSGGNVIIRTDVKTIVVRSRQNSVDINLQTDGTVVGQPQPSAPQPVTGQVKYYVGNANAADGVTPPTDGTTYTAGDEVTVSAAPSWAYGMFSHWQADDATLKNETTGATNGQFSAGEKFKMPASGVVLTAVYDATKYTIKFSTSGGPASVTPATPDMEFTMEAANPNQTFAGVSGTGYGFGGWEYNGKSYADIDAVRSDTRNGTITFPSSKEITFAAKWTAKTYTINYKDVGGGTFTGKQSSAPRNHTYGTDTTLKTPTRVGFTFDGWFADSSGNNALGNSNTLTATGYTDNIDLYAKWSIIYKTAKADWEVGDIILQKSDNSLVAIHKDAYTARDTNTYGNGVAVVYKNENRKVHIVGKDHAQKKWCLDTANGYSTNITSIQCEPDPDSSAGYTWTQANIDGNSNWQKLQQALQAVSKDDTNITGNYPAWEYCNAYGNTQGLQGELNGNWYLPTIAELYEIKQNQTVIENSLGAISGNRFTAAGAYYYWSSSQKESTAIQAYRLYFSSGTELQPLAKSQNSYVCAVHQLAY